jgi:transposase
MYKTKEILRLKWCAKLTHRQIGRSLGISPGTVGGAVSRATLLGLGWAQVEPLSEPDLQVALYGARRRVCTKPRPEPDLARIHMELRRPGVTLELLHLEYIEQHPEGYRYTAFCRRYKQWCERRDPRMRQVYQAGEKMLVDYSGKKPSIIDRQTGEVREVELFIAVLGASNLTFALATQTQQIGDWVHGHVQALEYFGGVPKCSVPDQLRSAVSSPHRYEPLIQRSFAELGRHYDMAIVPARPGRPRDKAKVEVAVQIAQRWILARIRNQQFYSLTELNERIGQLREELNQRPMKRFGGQSRRELFEKIERAELRPLPQERFELGIWKKAMVNIDYHIEFERHYYSVPHGLLKQPVELRATGATVEVFHAGKRVASHVRSRRIGQHTTTTEHMPKSHRAHAEWSPSRIINWADTIGPHTRMLVEAILSERPHPEMGYRSCLGILRLGKRYDEVRLEAACRRAVAVGARSYRHVACVLEKGLDRTPLDDEEAPQRSLGDHGNVRGSGYYH